MRLPSSLRGHERTTAYILLLFTVIVWGSTFAVVKDALSYSSPLFFNQIRMTLAFFVLAAVHFREWRHITRHNVLCGLAVGACLAAGYEFQTAGLVHTTSSKSAFLTATVVVLVPLLTAVPSFRAKDTHAPSPLSFLGVAVAFIGIVLLTIPSGTHLSQLFSSINIGDLLSLACALGFACHILTLSHASKNVPIAQLSTLQIGFAALLMTLTTPLIERPHMTFNGRVIASLFICSIFATAAAFSIQSWAQKHIAPTHTALMLSLEPVFALIVSLLVFNESLSLRSGSGAALIFAGILLTELISGKPIAAEPEANLF